MKAILVIVFVLNGTPTSQQIEQKDYDTCESTRRMMQRDWEDYPGWGQSPVSIAWCIVK